MLLRSLTIAGAGRFATPHTLSGLAPGLNVLAAPNGAGKSTFFEALRLAMFAAYKTSNKDLLGRLPTRNASLPLRIEVDFEVDGFAWRLEKQFLSGQFSRLHQGGRLVADGTEADARLWSLLGADRAERRHFDVLWLEQGNSADRLKLPDNALPTFNRAVELALGSVVDVSHARLLAGEIEAELEKSVTSRGAKKGSLLASLSEAVAAHEASLAEIDRRLASAADLRAELAGHRATLDLYARDGRAARLEAAAAAASQALSAALGRQQERLALDAAVAAARKAEGRAADDKAAASAGLDRLLQALANQAALDKVLRQARDEMHSVTASRPDRAGLDAMIQQQQSLRQQLALANLLARRSEAMARLPDLEQAAHQHASLVQSLAAAEAALAGLAAITPDDLAGLTAAEHELLEARAAARAGRARITVMRLGAGDVQVNGQPLADGGLDQSIDGAMAIAVPGLVSIHVEPPLSPGDLEGRLENAESRLRHALQDAGVASVADARTAVDARRFYEREVARLQVDLKAQAESGPDGKPAALRLEKARAGLGVFDAQLDQLDSGWRAVTPADPVSLQSALDDTQAAIVAATGEQEAHASRLHLASNAVVHASAAAEAAAGVVTSLRAERDEAGWQANQASAAKALDEAAAALALALQAVSDFERRHAGSPSLTELELAADRTAQASSNHHADVRQRSDACIRLESLLAGAGLDGLDEQRASLVDLLELDIRQKAREQARIDALTLLRDRLETAIQSEQARLTAPLNAAIAPYLGLVFPDATITFNEDFAPDQLVRPGSGRTAQAEDHTLLSMGTREQISLLARFALADVLDGMGQAWPVILDDALGFADDERLQAMFNALTLAARNRQVLVMTCHESAFASLGGNRVKIAPAG
jgi:hypothetical protein